MTRKFIGRLLAGAALVAGLVALASQVTASDHARGVPAAGNRPTAANTQTGDSGEAAVDLNHWQEARLVTGSGSKFKP